MDEGSTCPRAFLLNMWLIVIQLWRLCSHVHPCAKRVVDMTEYRKTGWGLEVYPVTLCQDLIEAMHCPQTALNAPRQQHTVGSKQAVCVVLHSAGPSDTGSRMEDASGCVHAEGCYLQGLFGPCAV